MVVQKEESAELLDNICEMRLPIIDVGLRKCNNADDIAKDKYAFTDTRKKDCDGNILLKGQMEIKEGEKRENSCVTYGNSERPEGIVRVIKESEFFGTSHIEQFVTGNNNFPQNTVSAKHKPVSLEQPVPETTLEHCTKQRVKAQSNRNRKDRKNLKRRNPEYEAFSSGSDIEELCSHAGLSKQRRVAANARERRRMHSLNVAFDELRAVMPSHDAGRQLSKFETLQMAQTYIQTLEEMLKKEEKNSSEL